MRNLDMLFVRACKSMNSDLRLKSVYRRYYLKNDNPTPHIMRILMRICEENNLCSPSQIMELYFEYERYSSMDGIERNSADLFYSVFKSFIMFAEIDQFEDYRVPAQFRNKEK